MRLASISIGDAPPIRRFEANALSDVVVLAGPNGVGKTRLLERVIGYLRGGALTVAVSGSIEATNPEEVVIWQGQESLDLSSATDMSLFRTLLQANRRRQKWQSSLVNFESDRSIQNLRPLEFSWDLQDPNEEELGWDFTFGYMRDRFQDTLHSMFRMIETQKRSIASRAINLRREGRTSMQLEFEDPMEPFKLVFSQLLGPKQLVDPSARVQKLQYEEDGRQLDFSTLSSGEREVVNIAFDFLLRGPQDCIVFFDEPELHLHPELSYRLIQTLQAIGTRNQFFFSTHSADIITASLDRSVFFVSRPRADATGAPMNQAIRVSDEDDTHRALRLLGQSIGIIALGRRLVLIEGGKSSLDKQTYGSITRGMFPGLVLVPTGGKHAITSFRAIHEAVLSRAVWGVEFFMLCDGDSAPPEGLPAMGDLAGHRLRVLPRYHLENYFLEETVWAEAFSLMEPAGSWLRDPVQIRASFRELAQGLISYATALAIAAKFRLAAGNVDIMPDDCHGKSEDDVVAMLQERAKVEVERIGASLDADRVAGASRQYFRALEASLESDTDAWKALIPGKPLLGQFARRAGLDAARAKTAYINSALKLDSGAFDEVIEVFRDFANVEQLDAPVRTTGGTLPEADVS